MIKAGRVYKSLLGYDEFQYLLAPESYPESYYIVDMLPCTRDGIQIAGYEYPIAIRTEDIGEEV